MKRSASEKEQGSSASKQGSRSIPSRQFPSSLSRALLIALFALGVAWWGFSQVGTTSPANRMSVESSLILLFLLLLGNAFFALTETALIALRPSWVKTLYEQKPRIASLLEKLKNEPTRFFSTVQIGTTLMGFFASAVAAMTLAVPLHEWLRPLEERWQVRLFGFSVVLVTFLTSFASIILGEIIPKSIALAYPERVAMLVAKPTSALNTAFIPLVWVIHSITDLLLKPFGIQAHHPAPIISEEELKILVEASEEQGVIEEEEKEMIHSIFEFTDTIAREVMTPRVDMHSVEVNTPPQELVALIQRTGHSRIPVYEGSIDNIIGIVHVKDLLRLCDGYTHFHLREAMRPAYFVPENKRVSELLEEFRRRRVHMAIVQDEYGGTAGLVTLEDLVEEIVGEIQDEYDAELVNPIQKLEDGSYLMDARLHLDDLNEQIETEIESEEFDTIGGFVFGLFGRPPQQGEAVEYQDWTFIVEQVDGHRIRRVRAIHQPPASAPSPSEERTEGH